MSPAFSLYLDLVRFAAACLVYLYHSNQRWLVSELLPASDYGHSSVVVFFVLSGYVIAFITGTKERDWRSYAASRFARIYSVALPAVVLTLALDAAGRALAPAVYGYPWGQFPTRVVASLAMLNEVWFVSITSFSNVPYWSICYESWYYALFGVVCFAPRRWAWPLAAVLLLLLGPKIALLAPVWALGVVLYRWRALERLPMAAAWGLVAGSVLGIVAFHRFGVSALLSGGLEALIGKAWHRELTFSKFFVGDYLLGGLVFCNFAGMKRVAGAFWPVLAPFERPIRWLAGFTLTLYLLHQPLFLFWGSVIRGDPAGPAFWWATTFATALSVVAIGTLTETRRGALRRAVLQRLAASPSPARV